MSKSSSRLRRIAKSRQTRRSEELQRVQGKELGLPSSIGEEKKPERG